MRRSVSATANDNGKEVGGSSGAILHSSHTEKRARGWGDSRSEIKFFFLKKILMGWTGPPAMGIIHVSVQAHTHGEMNYVTVN